MACRVPGSRLRAVVEASRERPANFVRLATSTQNSKAIVVLLTRLRCAAGLGKFWIKRRPTGLR